MSGLSWYVNAEPDDRMTAEARVGAGPMPAPGGEAGAVTRGGGDVPTVAGPAAAASAPSDSQLQKLVKLFPVEVVSLYIAADAFARSASTDAVVGDITARVLATGIVAVLGLLAVPAAFRRVRRVSYRTDRGRQMIAIGMGAFIVWCYAVGGFFQEVGWYEGWLAGLAIIVFLGVVFLYGPKGLVQSV